MIRLARAIVVVALATTCTSPNTKDQAMPVQHDDEGSPIELGEWTQLAAEGGGEVAIAGERTIAVGRQHATIWIGDQREASVDARAASPGFPRVLSDGVAWGPNVLGFDGTIALRSAAVPEPVPMNRGDVAQAYAWSSDGGWLVRSTSNANAGAAVTLHRGADGQRVTTLWQAIGLAPQALWVGSSSWVAIGTSPLRVVGLDGRELATLDLDVGRVVRLEASADERWLIAVDVNRTIAVIDTERWTVVGTWSGPWADASIAPSGAWVVGLGLDGAVRVGCVDADGIRKLGELGTIERAVSVRTSDDAIAVIGGGELRRASLHVRCGALTPE